MAVFSELDVWVDPVARSAAANMAVDEIVHEMQRSRPLLRIYRWSEAAVTLGYFERLSDAQQSFADAGLVYVRRWTGGGIVDHRNDVTYTLSIPKGHSVEQQRGNLSYALIHQALAESMQASGVVCQLTEEDCETEARACFVKPVAYDIVTPQGEKLAGAGQKRSRFGLLHQGSVQGISGREDWLDLFVKSLSERSQRIEIAEDALRGVPQLVKERYGNRLWTEKRV